MNETSNLPEDDTDPKSSQNDSDGKIKDEIILNAFKERYKLELDRTKDLDDKAGKIIGYVTIVTGLLVGVGTFTILGKLSRPEYYLPYFGGVGFLLAAIILSLIAIRLTEWKVAPEFEAMRSALIDPNYTSRTVLRRIFLAMGDATTTNSTKNNAKAKWIFGSWICLILGLGLILLYVIIFSHSGSLKA